MQKLLLKMLGGGNPKSAGFRKKAGIFGGVAGIVVNLLIFIMELVVGGIVNSVAVTADAFHNLTDVVSSVITIVSFKFSSKPADERHPFGHGRVEYLSALFVAMIIMVIGYEFIKSSLDKIFHPEAVTFSLVSLILILLAIPAKIALSRFNKGLGRLIGSSTLEATSFDALSDVFVLSVASVSLVLAAFTKIHVDGYIGVIVAVFIMYSGFTIAKQELSPLLGEAPDPELVKSINDGVLAADYVSGVHDLIIHNYGPGRSMATIHAEVPCDIPILRIHESIDRVEKYLSRKLGIILVVHMDPLNENDEAVKAAKKDVMSVLDGIKSVQSIHDFRIVGEGEHKNIIFDAVVNSSVVTQKDEEDLVVQIRDGVRKIRKHYCTIINIDHNYTTLK